MTETGILINQDIAVAAWTWNKFNLTPMFINRAFGLLNNGNLVGSVILHNFNGADVEFSLYGYGFLTPGVFKYIARTVLDMGVIRGTVHVEVNEMRMRRWLDKVGTLECIRKCYYGNGSNAAQYVVYRKQIVKLAGGRKWAPAHHLN